MNQKYSGSEYRDLSRKEENFVPEEVFDAYYRGNSAIPQTLDGVKLFLAGSLINENSELNWRKFLTSTLSPQQIEFLGNAMSAQHLAKGIDFATEATKHSFPAPPRIVRPDNFQTIWKTSKTVISGMILDYISPDRKIIDEQPKTVDEDIEAIQGFFSDQVNKKRIDNLKRIVGAIQISLDNSEIQQLLREYREGFQGHKNSPGRWENEYKSRFQKIIKSKIEEVLGTIPQEVDLFLK
jgi:hypothetical protein